MIGDQVKFGGMTFTPANGIMKWNPPEANDELGKLIDLHIK